MKRTLIALLSIGLCLSSVAGCKEAGTPSPSSTPTTVSTSSESESTQPNGELDWQIGSDTPSSFVASGGSTLSGQGTTVSKSSGNGTTQGPHATVNPEKNYGSHLDCTSPKSSSICTCTSLSATGMERFFFILRYSSAHSIAILPSGNSL